MCYLKVPDSTGGGSIDGRLRGQRSETYFVEKTLNPKWLGQRFVFKVCISFALELEEYARLACVVLLDCGIY